jgi:hypothetical protein
VETPGGDSGKRGRGCVKRVYKKPNGCGATGALALGPNQQQQKMVSEIWEVGEQVEEDKLRSSGFLVLEDSPHLPFVQGMDNRLL